MTELDAAALRRAIPEVVGILVRRGADFASAEDAVQTVPLAEQDRAVGEADGPTAGLAALRTVDESTPRY